MRIVQVVKTLVFSPSQISITVKYSIVYYELPIIIYSMLCWMGLISAGCAWTRVAKKISLLSPSPLPRKAPPK